MFHNMKVPKSFDIHIPRLTTHVEVALEYKSFMPVKSQNI